MKHLGELKELKDNETVYYKDICLRIKKANTDFICDNCYFLFKDCSEISCNYKHNNFFYEEVSEIESLVLQGDKDENS